MGYDRIWKNRPLFQSRILMNNSLEKCVRIGNDKQLKNDWNYCNEILLCESCKKSKANIVFQT